MTPAPAPIDTRPQPIVKMSGRPDAPDTVPVPPTGAPTSTTLSTAARTNGVSRPDDHFALAVYNQRVGNFEEALVQYREVIKRDELNAEAHNNLGLLYRDKGLLADAAKELQRAIAINPQYARAHNNLGVVYLSQGKLDSASAEFREVLAVDPRNIEALVNFGVVEKEAGRRDAARTSLKTALDLDPRNADAHYNLALVEDEAGNAAQALVHYKAFLQYGAVAHADLMEDVRKRVDAIARR
jgi:tetratricopeptide (TPR) repeat protein